MPSLDLGANAFRQNGSIKDDHALDRGFDCYIRLTSVIILA